jgi:hypothetical protein
MGAVIKGQRNFFGGGIAMDQDFYPVFVYGRGTMP